MPGGMPPHSLVVHHVVLLGNFRHVKYLRVQLCREWSELASPGVKGYIKGRGLSL